MESAVSTCEESDQGLLQRIVGAGSISRPCLANAGDHAGCGGYSDITGDKRVLQFRPKGLIQGPPTEQPREPVADGMAGTGETIAQSAGHGRCRRRDGWRSGSCGRTASPGQDTTRHCQQDDRQDDDNNE